MNADDLFAGPGGWDEGLRALGIFPLGIELDEQACETRRAAGHRTHRGDVAALDPFAFGPCDLVIASPPCPTFSTAGAGSGHELTDVIVECAKELVRGVDQRDVWRGIAYRGLLEAEVEPDRAIRDAAMSLLVVEPLRWAVALRPTYIALEQVPPVIDLWRAFGHLLEPLGYRVWAGVLNAADYGVPQTRERAFLMASRVGQPEPPAPTHARGGGLSLFGELLPWVSMAEALGWGATEIPYQTLAGGTAGGPCYERSIEEPAPTLDSKAVHAWAINTGRAWKKGGSRADAQTIPASEPAPTLDGDAKWHRVPWPVELPATTVAGDPRITARCHHDEGSQGANAKTTEQVQAGEYDGTEPIRLTVPEAAVLQSFPPDYPWQGTKTSIHTQIGNAVPPLLARRVIEALVG